MTSPGAAATSCSSPPRPTCSFPSRSGRLVIGRVCGRSSNQEKLDLARVPHWPRRDYWMPRLKRGMTTERLAIAAQVSAYDLIPLPYELEEGADLVCRAADHLRPERGPIRWQACSSPNRRNFARQPKGLMNKRASFRCVFKTRCGLPRRALFLTGEMRRLSCRRSSMRALGGQCPGRDVFGPT